MGETSLYIFRDFFYSDGMPKEFATPELNLLPEDDLLSRPGGKFLKWALSWGKKIVILTELMVVSAFLSRFWLDTTIANLSEEIDRKKAIIEASADFEKQFRETQQRINKIKQIGDNTSELVIYDRVKSLVPTGVTMKQLAMNGMTVSFNGTASDQLLSGMVTAFKGSADFGNVVIERVAKEEDKAGVNFSLTAEYVKQKI